MVRHGGTQFNPQHLGGRDRRISAKVHASLDYSEKTEEAKQEEGEKKEILLILHPKLQVKYSFISWS